MKTRRGIGSIELLLLVLFLAMLAATLVMVWQYSRIAVPNANPEKNIISSYEYAVDRLAGDARTAVSMTAGQGHLCLESASGTAIEWSLTDGNLRRSDGRNAPEIVVSGLHQGGFMTASATPDLFSIWLIPADTSAMPVFTSFTLRGNGI